MNAPLLICGICDPDPCTCPDAQLPVGSAKFAMTVWRKPKDAAYHVRKTIDLDAEGNKVDAPRVNLYEGTAKGAMLTLGKLCEVLQKSPSSDFAFLTAGVSSRDTLVVTEGVRSPANFPFPSGPALLPLDGDYLTYWGFRNAAAVVAAYRKLGVNADIVSSSSASSYLLWPRGSSGLKGLHCFAVIDHGTAIPEVLFRLHKRAWLHGWGRIQVSSSGVLLVRSIVDTALKTPNQPIFEFGAVLLDERIQQDRRVEMHAGDVRLLRSADITPLTEDEEAEYNRLVAEAKADEDTQAAAKRATKLWLAERLKDVPKAERAARRAQLLAAREKTHRDLADDFLVTLNDRATVSVAEVKADTGRFDGLAIRDPFEPDYGTSKASIKLTGQKDGRPKILSRAHGLDVVYFLDERPFDTSEWGKDEGESTAAYEEWSAAVAAADDVYAVDLLIGKVKADARLAEIHRDTLATNIFKRFKALSDDKRTSPKTLAQIKKVVRPTPIVEAPSNREIWMLDDLALVRVGGRVAVLMEKETRASGILDTTAVNDMRTFSKNHTLIRPHPETGDPVKVDMFDEWLKHGETRRYRGIQFAPDGGREGFFNLWQGFVTKPVPGDCSRFLAHIREVICAGDEGAFVWVINWLADIIQNPGRKPGTALVLRGGEGAGKGKAFADQLRDLIGPYLYCKVSRGHGLTTNFNKHLAGKLLIFANESVWGGDRSKEGALKDMITEDVQMIEPKGLDAFEVKDYARLLFATNEDWAVPVGADARRYTVLDVANHRKGDDTYFRVLYGELNNGGREAFMHLLMTRDLSGFNVHQSYKTAALLDLKLMRLDYADRWLLEELMSRHFDVTDTYDDLAGDGWPARWEKKVMHARYEEFARDRGDRHTMDSVRFSAWLKGRLPEVRGTRPNGKPDRPRFYVLPDLTTCRRAFEAFIGHAMDWGVDELDT